MKITDNMIQQIVTAANATTYSYFGLRIEDGRDYEAGEYLPDSRVWIDGEPTEEELDGTSVVHIETNDDMEVTPDAVREAVYNATHDFDGFKCSYLGDTLILAGDTEQPSVGEDRGERVFKTARCIQSFA